MYIFIANHHHIEMPLRVVVILLRVGKNHDLEQSRIATPYLLSYQQRIHVWRNTDILV